MSATRSPARSTRRPPPIPDSSRISANADTTAPAAVGPTPNCRANSGTAGTTMPNPSATQNATSARVNVSRGSPRKLAGILTAASSPRVRSMLDHLGVQAADVEAAVDFYVRAFAPIGLREIMRYPMDDSFAVGLGGPDGFPHFWLSPGMGPETRELTVDGHKVEAVHHGF